MQTLGLQTINRLSIPELFVSGNAKFGLKTAKARQEWGSMSLTNNTSSTKFESCNIVIFN